MQRAPRAVIAENDAGPELANGMRSDYLVVKSTSIGMSATAQKWTYVTTNDTVPGGFVIAHWDDPSEELENNDWIITERPVVGAGGARQRVLVMAAQPVFSTQFGPGGNSVYRPELDAETHLVYGVGQVPPRAPFNRADFYVSTPEDNMPSKCAPNTGILYKAVMNHGDGEFQQLPLFDCVADMQVVFFTDADADGMPEYNDADFITGLTAQQIRDQVRGVVIYILAHEGQRDPNFAFNNFTTAANSGFVCEDAPPNTCIRVGYREAAGPAGLFGREFDLSLIGPDFDNYRWKVYQFAVQPPNLR
jgi:hypothetical protein